MLSVLCMIKVVNWVTNVRGSVMGENGNFKLNFDGNETENKYSWEL